MASTYTLISSQVLASSASSVTFSSIPATYTDLVLRMSARTDNAAANNNVNVQLNSDTASNYSAVTVRGNGATAGTTIVSSLTSIQESIQVDGSTATTNTFGNTEIYIPSYTASQNKPLSMFSVQENNNSSAYIVAAANLWRNTAAVTSIYLVPNTASNFIIGSSFYLYGISNA